MGQELSSKTQPTQNHFSLQVLADDFARKSAQQSPNVSAPKPEVAQPKATKTISGQRRLKEDDTSIDGPRPKGELSRSRCRFDSSDLVAVVRKNPNGYAVWMIEQEPGEYAVLLVKLDRDGGMADSWQMGEPFRNRTAQGSYALDVARDLGIKLMDVVKS